VTRYGNRSVPVEAQKNAPRDAAASNRGEEEDRGCVIASPLRRMVRRTGGEGPANMDSLGLQFSFIKYIFMHVLIGNSYMFTLRQLRYFVAVADSLSFTRAAQSLHISQPPLSQQIQTLEEDLGVRLLDRTRRRVRLTEPGRLFLDEARSLLAQAESARVTVNRAAAGYGGRLRLAYPVSVAFHRTLPRALLEFARVAPGVQVELNEMYTTAQYEALLAGQIDVGFVRAQPPPALSRRESIAIRELDREHLMLALPSSHRLARRKSIAMRELADTPFVAQPGRSGSTLHDALMALAMQAGFHPAIVQEAQQVTGLLALVSAGIGVALVPASLRAVKLEAVTLVELSDSDAYLMLGLATRGDQRSPALERFLAMIDTLDALPREGV